MLQPVTARWFEECSDRSVTELCTTTRRVRYLGRDDEVLHDDEAQWRYSSWGTLYRALLADFPVLVLDEPTANVDADRADALLVDLLAASTDPDGRRAVVIISHLPVPDDLITSRLRLG